MKLFRSVVFIASLLIAATLYSSFTFVVFGQDRYDRIWMESYEMREKLVQDKFRPRYHFAPPEGRWNDINGAVFHNGRYHLGYLQKIANTPGERDFSSWQHISSRDLLHWRYHKASLREPLEGHHGDYFNSGDVMEGTEVPTIITNMPRHGIVVYQSHDENLDDWVPLPQNPVIPVAPGELGEEKRSTEFPESMIFDPSGWKEGDTWYALIGSKNYRPGYEGDSTSLFKSTDLVDWEYVGPFYQSDRKWTHEDADCACSDFFAFGKKHMLLMHSHRPYYRTQYYIGEYENERFHPEQFGQLSWLGAMISGPETLVDDQGRRIFWGWISDAKRANPDTGWQSIMTLPWHLSTAEDNTLRIDPVEELKSLRYDERRHPDISLDSGDEVMAKGFSGDTVEIKLRLEPEDATRFGAKLLCSPNLKEETILTYDRKQQQFEIDFEKASREKLIYRNGPTTLRKGNLKQVIPFSLKEGEVLDLNIFVDRSVIEVFVNSRICLVQRVYPTRKDSTQFRLFSEDGKVQASQLTKWEMDATNPW
ncbi:MAG: glycoside hydrolase family 32 protein [Verrucomicrobiota bacterium]